jgi:DNA repair ATPase RecN
MKKFSKITNQKVSEEPKIERKISESDTFKYQVMSLMDNLLKVQMYGPITRYHVAGDMKVVGKEMFVEALIDLLDDKSKSDKVKLLESLKLKINNWEAIDEKIDELDQKSEFKYRNLIKSLYNKYKNDKNILMEQVEKGSKRIKSIDSLEKRYKACESLYSESGFDKSLIKEMSIKYLERINELNCK